MSEISQNNFHNMFQTIFPTLENTILSINEKTLKSIENRDNNATSSSLMDSSIINSLPFPYLLTTSPFAVDGLANIFYRFLFFLLIF
jgi:hypothetical protein